jgi:hypothetical protein
MHGTEYYNLDIDDELPDNDDILQEILNYSFQQYYNEDDDIDWMEGDMDNNVNTIYNTATTVTNTNVTQIDNIFKDTNLKRDECSICINNEKLIKCYQCVGHICKLCITKIYKKGNGKLKCPFCNKILNIAQLKIHNRNIYSSNTKNTIQQPNPCNSKQYNIRDEELSVDEKNLTYTLANTEKYNNSDYDSNPENIESLKYKRENEGDFTYMEQKYGFTVSLYGDHIIHIKPFNKNRTPIMFACNLFNCKYLLILYLILIRFKDNSEWNCFIKKFDNYMKSDKFNSSSNYRKRFLWNSYLDLLY